MAFDKLFGNSVKPACKYCNEAYQKLADSQILCIKKGIVPEDSSCRKFFYDPLKRIPPRPKPLFDYQEEDFSLDTST